ECTAPNDFVLFVVNTYLPMNLCTWLAEHLSVGPPDLCHAIRRKHEGWDTAKLPKLRSKGRVRSMDLLKDSGLLIGSKGDILTTISKSTNQDNVHRVFNSGFDGTLFAVQSELNSQLNYPDVDRPTLMPQPNSSSTRLGLAEALEPDVAEVVFPIDYLEIDHRYPISEPMRPRLHSSKVCNEKKTCLVPQPPMSVRATTEVNVPRAVVSWEYDGACLASEFQVSIHEPEGSFSTNVVTRGLSHTVTNLPVCVTLQPAVLGRNKVGSSPQTNGSPFTIDAVPFPPKSVRVTMQARLAVVTWEYDGACAATGFRVTAYEPRGSFSKTVETTSLRTQISDLPQCVTLLVSVLGYNLVGIGPKVESSTFRIDKECKVMLVDMQPEWSETQRSPVILDLRTAPDASVVMVSWDYDHDCAVAEFTVTVYDSNKEIVSTLETSEHEIRLHDLPKNVALFVGVQGHNSIGSGPEVMAKQAIILADPIAPLAFTGSMSRDQSQMGPSMIQMNRTSVPRVERSSPDRPPLAQNQTPEQANSCVSQDAGVCAQRRNETKMEGKSNADPVDSNFATKRVMVDMVKGSLRCHFLGDAYENRVHEVLSRLYHQKDITFSNLMNITELDAAKFIEIGTQKMKKLLMSLLDGEHVKYLVHQLDAIRWKRLVIMSRCHRYSTETICTRKLDRNGCQRRENRYILIRSVKRLCADIETRVDMSKIQSFADKFGFARDSPGTQLNLSFMMFLSLPDELHEIGSEGIRRLPMIRRTFSRITRMDFQILYGVYVGPLLEYANPVVYSGRTKDVILIERVQPAATKMVAGLKKKIYRRKLHLKVFENDLVTAMRMGLPFHWKGFQPSAFVCVSAANETFRQLSATATKQKCDGKIRKQIPVSTVTREIFTERAKRVVGCRRVSSKLWSDVLRLNNVSHSSCEDLDKIRFSMTVFSPFNGPQISFIHKTNSSSMLETVYANYSATVLHQHRLQTYAYYKCYSGLQIVVLHCPNKPADIYWKRLSTKSWFYGSETSVLNTGVMLSMMIMVSSFTTIKVQPIDKWINEIDRLIVFSILQLNALHTGRLMFELVRYFIDWNRFSPNQLLKIIINERFSWIPGSPYNQPIIGLQDLHYHCALSSQRKSRQNSHLQINLVFTGDSSRTKTIQFRSLIVDLRFRKLGGFIRFPDSCLQWLDEYEEQIDFCTEVNSRLAVQTTKHVSLLHVTIKSFTVILQGGTKNEQLLRRSP
ncbi:hypothetical protein CLF_107320, partial [Clonorchis sinensis]